MNKNDYKRKGKGRPKSKPIPKEKSTKSETETVRESPNDPSWYTVSNQLAKDVSSLSFNTALGSFVTLAPHVYNSGEGMPDCTPKTRTWPGIMSIYVAPVPGFSATPNSPINIAARNIYSFVRHANSGHSNYDSPDLMLYILAMANCYAMYGWMTRLYGQAVLYTQLNRYYGDYVIKSHGIAPESLRRNLANFRTFINTFALKLSAFSVPATMPIFKRWMWMFSNAFLDEDNPKAQMYMYEPVVLHRYVESGEGGVGMLKAVEFTWSDRENQIGLFTNMSLEYVMNYADAMIDPIIQSEDMNIMSGDILKAYGYENCWKLSMIDENFAVLPIYSEEVLAQIHNTRFTGRQPVNMKEEGYPSNFGVYDVWQDTTDFMGSLYCRPSFKFYQSCSYDCLLDFWKQDVTPEDVLVASRNTIAGKTTLKTVGGTGPVFVTDPEVCGTELPFCGVVWQIEFTGGLPVFDPTYVYDTDTYATNTGAFLALERIGAFNEHPIAYKYSSSNHTLERIYGQVDNFTVVSPEDLKKMHETALLSLFAVPLLGNIVK